MYRPCNNSVTEWSDVNIPYHVRPFRGVIYWNTGLLLRQVVSFTRSLEIPSSYSNDDAILTPTEHVNAGNVFRRKCQSWNYLEKKVYRKIYCIPVQNTCEPSTGFGDYFQDMFQVTFFFL